MHYIHVYVTISEIINLSLAAQDIARWRQVVSELCLFGSDQANVSKYRTNTMSRMIIDNTQ